MRHSERDLRLQLEQTARLTQVQQMQTGHAVSKSPHGALEMNNGCWKACQAAGQNWVAVCIGSAQQVYAVAADGQNTFVVGVVTADRVYQGRGWINIPALRECVSTCSSQAFTGTRGRKYEMTAVQLNDTWLLMCLKVLLQRVHFKSCCSADMQIEALR